MYNFSIIIPHYNSPHLLQRLLNSIPKREDLQIIIVDDNSDPNKVDFNNFPGLKDDNTEVFFTKEGKGAGYARNVGLQHALGKWLIFSDSDDLFVTSNFSEMMDKYVDSISDLIYFNVDLIDENLLEILEKRTNEYPYRTHLIRGTEEDYEWIQYRFTNPWAKFVKREFVAKHDIQYDEIIAGNDAMFTIKCGHYAKNIEHDSTVIYQWAQRTSGNITSNISKKAMIAKLDLSYRMNLFFRCIKKSKYRYNLFISHFLPVCKSGYSYIPSFFMILKKTEKRYLLQDLLSFFNYAILKSLKKIS